VALTGGYWVNECEWIYWWVTGIGKLLTVGERIVGTFMVSGDDWMLLGDLMGREILVGERNCETVECRRVHSGELHGEWC